MRFVDGYGFSRKADGRGSLTSGGQPLLIAPRGMHHPAAAHVAPMMPERQATGDHSADHQRGAERFDVDSTTRARDWRRLALNDHRRGLPLNRRRIVLDDHG